ncbi:MAG: MOSC domain-containing protein [Dehalococcoidia bacterium]
MREQAAVELVAGVGIVGDRYALGRGHWSDPRWPDQELTLVMAEVADQLALAPAQLRRNLVTNGIDLETLIGVSFRIGDTLLFGVRRCDPCGYIERFTRMGCAAALGSRGGLRARILIGGHVHVGDAVVAARTIAGERDDGERRTGAR